MAYYPYAADLGAHYRLVNADGVEAFFNIPGNSENVGMLTELSGLDSPDVRESAQELVEADGGVHGNFYFGRRPFTMNGIVFGHSTGVERTRRLDLARRASLALRGDSTLTFKPANRIENKVTNPKFFGGSTVDWTDSQSAGITSITSAVANMPDNASEKGWRLAGTNAADTTTRAMSILTGTGTALYPVEPGKTYTVSYDVYVVLAVAGEPAANRGWRTGVLWYPDNNGSASNHNNGLTTPSMSTTVSTRKRIYDTFTCPEDSSFARLQLGWVTNSSSDAVNGYITNVRFTEGTDTAYLDGDSAGMYWGGDQGVTESGNFIEMMTTCRRQQPWRESGGWNKTFQLGMVSEYAVLFSRQLKTVAGSPASLENRGNYSAYPLVELTGAAVNPTITASGSNGKLWTTGLTLASGEKIVFDMLSHTAAFTAGARSGQSGNRYIDFNQTVTWPNVPGASTVTFTASAGTQVVTYRDVWA